MLTLGNEHKSKNHYILADSHVLMDYGYTEAKLSKINDKYVSCQGYTPVKYMNENKDLEETNVYTLEFDEIENISLLENNKVVLESKYSKWVYPCQLKENDKIGIKININIGITENKHKMRIKIKK